MDNNSISSNMPRKCPVCGKTVYPDGYGWYNCPCCGYGQATLPKTICEDSKGDVNIGGFVGRYGWICPKCGGVMSPYESTCPFCSPVSKEITWTASTHVEATQHHSNADSRTVNTYE